MIYLLSPTPGAETIMTVFSSFLFDAKASHEIINSYDQFYSTNFKSGDTIFACVPVGDHTKNYDIIKFLKSKKLNINFILDHWHNKSDNFYDRQTNISYLPDNIFCIDGEMKKQLMSNSEIPSKILHVVGHPAIEYTAKKRLSDEQINKFKISHGFEQSFYSLFLDPIKGKHINDIGYNEIDVVEFVLKCAADLNLQTQILIKPHPRTDPSLIKESIERLGYSQALLVNTDVNPISLVNASDKVMGMTSIVLAHALALEKDTCSIQKGANQLGKKRSNHHYEKILINDKQAMSNFLFTNTKKLLNYKLDYSGACDKIYNISKQTVSEYK